MDMLLPSFKCHLTFVVDFHLSLFAISMCNISNDNKLGGVLRSFSCRVHHCPVHR